MDFAREQDQGAVASGVLRRRKPDRIAEVTRAVGIRLVCTALRPCEDDWSVGREQPVDEIDALFQCVGPVRHDDAADGRTRRVLDHTPGERERELTVDVEARHTDEVVELERRRIEPAEHLDELVAGEDGDELARARLGTHRDRPPSRDDHDGLIHGLVANPPACTASASIPPPSPSSSSSPCSFRPRSLRRTVTTTSALKIKKSVTSVVAVPRAYRSGRIAEAWIRPTICSGSVLSSTSSTVRSKSFHVRVNPKRAAPKMPVQTRGSVTSRNVCARLAPRSRAASSMCSSYRFQTASMTRKPKGIPHTEFAPS